MAIEDNNPPPHIIETPYHTTGAKKKWATPTVLKPTGGAAQTDKFDYPTGDAVVFYPNGNGPAS